MVKHIFPNFFLLIIPIHFHISKILSEIISLIKKQGECLPINTRFIFAITLRTKMFKICIKLWSCGITSPTFFSVTRTTWSSNDLSVRKKWTKYILPLRVRRVYLGRRGPAGPHFCLMCECMDESMDHTCYAIILHIMKQELFSDFKVSKYFTPPLICKYIAQIIYFPSILSLVFVLSRAKLKEAKEETAKASTFLPPTENKK